MKTDSKPQELITDSLGWLYREDIRQGDCRKLVSLRQDGMEWVGIRAWNQKEHRWYNGNDPERADILGWMDLPQTVRRHYVRGILVPELKPNEN